MRPVQLRKERLGQGTGTGTLTCDVGSHKTKWQGEKSITVYSLLSFAEEQGHKTKLAGSKFKVNTRKFFFHPTHLSSVEVLATRC